MVEIGQIVYAKKIKNPTKIGLRINWIELTATGHFLTLVLGHARKGSPPPTQVEALALLMQIGWYSGDDITECFGDEGFEKLHKFLAKKYNGVVK